MTEKAQARLRLATVISLESRRRAANSPMHGEKLVTGQLYAHPSKGLDQSGPGVGRNALAFLPFLDRISGPTDIGSHRRERFPTAKDIVKRAHATQYASDGLSVQEPPMIPMTTLAPVRTISPMGRGTTPVKFRAEMATRLTSARIVAKFATKKEAADALGIGLDRYEKWESGRTPVPAQYIGPICALFGVDANYLYDIEPRPAAREQKKAG